MLSNVISCSSLHVFCFVVNESLSLLTIYYDTVKLKSPICDVINRPGSKCYFPAVNNSSNKTDC